jgi:hypothetical protein
MNRNEFISQYTRINRKQEDVFLKPVQRAIHSKVAIVIEKLREGGVSAANAWLTMDFHNEEIEKVIRELYQVVGLKHARLNYSRLLPETRGRKFMNIHMQTKGFGFNKEWANFITNFLNRYLLEKVTIEISHTTRDALLRALSIMTTQGLSVDGMISHLQDWPYERYQAARIVRTEVNRAANAGATAQQETSEYQQLKQWIAVHDNRTRGMKPKDHTSHIGLDGVKIDSEDVFVDPRNGDRLRFPGDPNASAESTINCRCAIGYEFKRDINGNLIPKRRTTAVIYPNQNRPRRVVTI